MTALTLLSSFIGWVYTAAWSLSFYGQFILNWRRKSVEGLSIDFTYLNPLGFACMTAFNAALLRSPVIRQEYRDRHGGHAPSVRGNDLAFAVHALVISSLTLGQSLIYRRELGQSVSRFNAFAISFILIGIFAATAATYSLDKLQWLDLLYLLSYVKLYISLTKYLPQAFINFKRKSTVGWSIENIILDFTGGTLSLGQLLLDGYINSDWRSVTGNPVKLGLSLLSIAFDVVFLVQHYVLYKTHPSPQEERLEQEGQSERSALLGGDGSV